MSSIRWASTGAKKTKDTPTKETKATKTTKAAPKAPKAEKAAVVDKPKRPLTSYINFCNATRAGIAASNPSFKFTDIGKELGARWRNLSDEEKAKWK
jgi:structure-specific recognition protein 1